MPYPGDTKLAGINEEEKEFVSTASTFVISAQLEITMFPQAFFGYLDWKYFNGYSV